MFDWREVSQRRGIAATLTVLAGLSILAPLRPSASPETSVGLFLIAGAILEWVHGQRRPTVAERLSAWREGAVTLVIAALLLSAPLLSGNALVLFLAVSFIIEGARHLARGLRRPGPGQSRRLTVGTLNLVAGLALLWFLRGDAAVVWTVAAAGAFRLFVAAGRVSRARVLRSDEAGDSLIEDLQLLDVPELKALGDTLELEAAARAPVDRGWVTAFLATLLAIHSGRMGGGFSLSSLLGPVAAVLGDIVVALLFTMGVALPFHLMVQRLSHPFERRAWRWLVTRTPTSRRARLVHSGVRTVLMSRLRSEMQWQLARLSLPAAIGRGVRIGLPFAAIIAATVPMWGMSWYFDT
jgi:uncharacterized membrane protein HdeD (DUF308 family)